MSDKRSVATDALETLGTAPLDDTAKRDAIHLAVMPAIASSYLNPGQHISVVNGVAEVAEPGKGLGIVDPFLTRQVRPAERFWFVMYPRTIKSLRHVWSHPAFPDEPGASADRETDLIVAADAEADGRLDIARRLRAPHRAESERWLREFCASADCPGYEQVMGKVADVADGCNESWDEDYLHFDGRDAHGEIPAEFWDHAEIVLGRKIERRPTYFSCSC